MGVCNCVVGCRAMAEICVYLRPAQSVPGINVCACVRGVPEIAIIRSKWTETHFLDSPVLFARSGALLCVCCVLCVEPSPTQGSVFFKKNLLVTADIGLNMPNMVAGKA